MIKETSLDVELVNKPVLRKTQIFVNFKLFSETFLDFFSLFQTPNDGESIDETYKFSVAGNHLPPRKSVGTVNTTSFGHMPYCPKSPEYQQYVRWRIDNNRLPEMSNIVGPQIDEKMSFIENYVSKRLRQNNNFTCNSGAVYPKGDFHPSLAYPECNSLKQALSWPTLSEMMDHGDVNLPWSMTDLTETGGFDGESSNFDDDEEVVIDDGGGDVENRKDRLYNFWKSAIFSVSLCVVQFWYCFTSNEKYKQEMRRRRGPQDHSFGAVNSVSKIDKVSRIMFPLIFFILNVIYWTYYIHERSTDFNQGEINLNY